MWYRNHFFFLDYVRLKAPSSFEAFFDCLSLVCLKASYYLATFSYSIQIHAILFPLSILFASRVSHFIGVLILCVWQCFFVIILVVWWNTILLPKKTFVSHHLYDIFIIIMIFFILFTLIFKFLELTNNHVESNSSKLFCDIFFFQFYLFLFHLFDFYYILHLDACSHPTSKFFLSLSLRRLFSVLFCKSFSCFLFVFFLPISNGNLWYRFCKE